MMPGEIEDGNPLCLMALKGLCPRTGFVHFFR